MSEGPGPPLTCRPHHTSYCGCDRPAVPEASEYRRSGCDTLAQGRGARQGHSLACSA